VVPLAAWATTLYLSEKMKIYPVQLYHRNSRRDKEWSKDLMLEWILKQYENIKN